MELVEYCKRYTDLNISNLEFYNFIKKSIIENNITNKRKLRKFIVDLIYEKTGNKRKTITYSYYNALGWNNRFDIFKHHYKFNTIEDFLIEKINNKININNKSYVNDKLNKILNLDDSFDINTISSLFIFKNTSIFSISHWIELGYNENESINIVKKIQSDNSKKRLSKYTKRELSEQSVWSKKFWEKTDTPHKYKQYNKMCPEFYDSIEDYTKMLELHSKTISNNIKAGKYDNFLSPSTISKKEIDFFNYISTYIDCKHIQFKINCRKNGGTLYFADGYIKKSNGIILLEFDGIYWHNIEYDKNRDSLILETRQDIIGIIRISDKYYSKYKNNIINNLEYAIKQIESKKCKVIRFY